MSHEPSCFKSEEGMMMKQQRPLHAQQESDIACHAPHGNQLSREFVDAVDVSHRVSLRCAEQANGGDEVMR